MAVASTAKQGFCCHCTINALTCWATPLGLSAPGVLQACKTISDNVNPRSRSAAVVVADYVALVCSNRRLCTGVGKHLHTLASHLTLGEPTGFSSGALTNSHVTPVKQLTNTTAFGVHTINVGVGYVNIRNRMRPRAPAVNIYDSLRCSHHQRRLRLR